MGYSESFIKSYDGHNIFTCEWKTDLPIKGVVCLVHGQGEHCGRFKHVTSALNLSGYSVVAFDLRGHGKSSGKRGHIRGYDKFLDDIDMIIDKSKELYPNKPCFLYGHSLGGNLVLNYALRRKQKLSGVISTSPWLTLSFKPAAIKVWLAIILDKIFPSFSQSSGLEKEALSHDAKIIEAYTSDPLVHSIVSARLFLSVYKSGIWAIEHANEFSVPLLLMHGSEDRITSSAASSEFAEQIKENCTFKLWEGLFHELHNEYQKGEVIGYIINWLDSLT